MNVPKISFLRNLPRPCSKCGKYPPIDGINQQGIPSWTCSIHRSNASNDGLILKHNGTKLSLPEEIQLSTGILCTDCCPAVESETEYACDGCFETSTDSSFLSHYVTPYGICSKFLPSQMHCWMKKDWIFETSLMVGDEVCEHCREKYQHSELVDDGTDKIVEYIANQYKENNWEILQSKN